MFGFCDILKPQKLLRMGLKEIILSKTNFWLYFESAFLKIAPKTEVRRLFSKFFTANFLFWEYLGIVCFRPKTNVFCRKKIELHFPMNKGLTVPK